MSLCVTSCCSPRCEPRSASSPGGLFPGRRAICLVRCLPLYQSGVTDILSCDLGGVLGWKLAPPALPRGDVVSAGDPHAGEGAWADLQSPYMSGLPSWAVSGPVSGSECPFSSITRPGKPLVWPAGVGDLRTWERSSQSLSVTEEMLGGAASVPGRPAVAVLLSWGPRTPLTTGDLVVGRAVWER